MQSDYNQKDMSISYVSGGHIYSKDNSKVEVLYVPSNTKYLPIEVCKVFVSLNRFDMKPFDLREISRKVFTKCDKLKFVQVTTTMISSLPEDVFNDLISLEALDFSNNRIEYLPAKLFANNPSLNTIKFNGNVLKIVALELPASLKKATFNSNPCIRKDFPESFSKLALLVTEIEQNCLGRRYDEIKSKVTSFESQINLQKEKLLKFQNEANDLSEIAKQAKADVDDCKAKEVQTENVVQQLRNSTAELSAQIRNLKTENHEKTEEIKVLAANHSDKVVELFTNLTILTQNLERTQSELKAKQRELAKHSDESKNLTSLYRESKAISVALKSENDKTRTQKIEIEKKVAQMTTDKSRMSLVLNAAVNRSESLALLYANVVQMNKELEVKVIDLETNNTEIRGDCSLTVADLQSNLNETAQNLTDVTQLLELKELEKVAVVAELSKTQSLSETKNRSEVAKLKDFRYFLIFLLALVSIGWIVTAVLYVKKRKSANIEQVYLSSLLCDQDRD